ncbi:hypothetical protein [Flavobacterium sp. H122]|uniref:hypothetical protein n=1 Tax=Flavobacterium sp. H122 TaxID=2529860 RepID=UPI0010AA0E4F|nr:hypothetical protein [Flavobacterium sp. H122]
MNKFLITLLFLSIVACQTVKIKNETYKVSDNAIELGSLGNASSKLNLENTFEIKSLPVLENKIKLNVDIVPFTKKTAKAYKLKNKYNQGLNKLNYVDSIPTKPELVLIHIEDKLGYVNELNAEHNKSLFTLIEDLQNLTVIYSIAIYVNDDDLSKIKQADAFYLVNNQDKKYTIGLYKQGKKTESIDMFSKTIIGYQTNTLCWSQTPRGKWYIADMISKSSSCKGKTFSKVKEAKKEESLFKM